MSTAPRQEQRPGLEEEDAARVAEAPNLPRGALLLSQCNQDMLRKVRRYARRVAASIADAGGPGGDDCAEELLQDCISDTIAGTLTWDPSVKLEVHLMSRIRARGRDARRRALQHPHSSLDEPCDNQEEGSTVLDEVEETLLRREHDSAEAHARRRLLQLRELAPGDQDLRAILDAVDEGAEGKAEILAATGLSEKAYRNARLRLRRLGDRILGVDAPPSTEEVDA